MSYTRTSFKQASIASIFAFALILVAAGSSEQAQGSMRPLHCPGTELLVPGSGRMSLGRWEECPSVTFECKNRIGKGLSWSYMGLVRIVNGTEEHALWPFRYQRWILGGGAKDVALLEKNLAHRRCEDIRLECQEGLAGGPKCISAEDVRNLIAKKNRKL